MNWWWLAGGLLVGAILLRPRKAGRAPDKADFVRRFREAWEASGSRIPYQVQVVQAALESGWGTSRIAQSFNNLFGLKGRGTAGDAPGGAIEYRAGQYVREPARWAVFRSWQEAIRFHSEKLLRPGSRWDKAGIGRARTIREWFEALKRAGYATEPRYVEIAVRVARGLGFDPDAPLT